MRNQGKRAKNRPAATSLVRPTPARRKSPNQTASPSTTRPRAGNRGTAEGGGDRHDGPYTTRDEDLALVSVWLKQRHEPRRRPYS